MSSEHRRAIIHAHHFLKNCGIDAFTICDSDTHGKNKIVHCDTIRAPEHELALGYTWYPNADDKKEKFNIDLAVLKNKKLHIAVEIQNSHANSPEKIQAFTKYKIRSVQITAKEINDRFQLGYHVDTSHTGGYREESDCAACTKLMEENRRVELRNHVIDAAKKWMCAVCDPSSVTEATTCDGTTVAPAQGKKKMKMSAVAEEKNAYSFWEHSVAALHRKNEAVDESYSEASCLEPPQIAAPANDSEATCTLETIPEVKNEHVITLDDDENGVSYTTFDELKEGCYLIGYMIPKQKNYIKCKEFYMSESAEGVLDSNKQLSVIPLSQSCRTMLQSWSFKKVRLFLRKVNSMR